MSAARENLCYKEGVPIEPTSIVSWTDDWAWGLPMIVLTVAIHSFGLRLVDWRVTLLLGGDANRRRPWYASGAIIYGTVLFASILHGIEAAIWSGAYVLLGALPNREAAMLYSLSAMTSYGHAEVYLPLHWQLMGSLESLNGWILFGLTTAFLFSVMRKVWPSFDRF